MDKKTASSSIADNRTNNLFGEDAFNLYGNSKTSSILSGFNNTGRIRINDTLTKVQALNTSSVLTSSNTKPQTEEQKPQAVEKIEEKPESTEIVTTSSVDQEKKRKRKRKEHHSETRDLEKPAIIEKNPNNLESSVIKTEINESATEIITTEPEKKSSRST